MSTTLRKIQIRRDSTDPARMAELRRRFRIDGGEWDEEAHPRAENGQFGSGGGVEKKSEKKAERDKENRIAFAADMSKTWIRDAKGKAGRLTKTSDWRQVEEVYTQVGEIYNRLVKDTQDMPQDHPSRPTIEAAKEKIKAIGAKLARKRDRLRRGGE